ncbi:MAG TPA: CBS domain-containing protein [Syntrophales bacterium]|nr:CBS domain-containing protein [Syntrophales bacterium]HPQ45069.1 CBS domain-containing protein [Syntrophales bacterium]
MFVGKKMTRDLVTVTADTSILKVKNLLRQHQIDQLPVVEGKKLIGIITDRDIRDNSPSPASTLSVHELNYLLSNMKAEDAMTRKVFTTTPGSTIEEAALLINEKHVNSLPVVAGDELVGLITTCDLLNVLLEFMGVSSTPSCRVELRLSSNIGEIAKVANIINDMGLRIVSLVSTVDKDDSGVRPTLVRVATDNIDELCGVLKDAGYIVVNEYRMEK